MLRMMLNAEKNNLEKNDRCLFQRNPCNPRKKMSCQVTFGMQERSYYHSFIAMNPTGIGSVLNILYVFFFAKIPIDVTTNTHASFKL